MTAIVAAAAGLGALAIRAGRGAAHEAAPAIRAVAEPAASAERQGLRAAAPAIERQVAQRGVATASHAEANGLFRVARSDAAVAAPAVAARASTLAAASTEVGKRLFALRTRVPPAVFQELIRRWQQNDADVRAAALTPAGPDRDARVQQLVGEQRAIDEEVRKLEAQYG